MGYMGLESIGESDNASDAACDADLALAKQLAKNLKQRGNSYNTCGIVNVALYFEDRIKSIGGCEEMIDVLETTKSGLQKLILEIQHDKDWKKDDNQVYHLTAYKRMLKNLRKIKFYKF